MRLLKRYFQMYWLKPFDAVNDAANAAALLKFDWSRTPALEIGGGDGVFSFIMHGGKFHFSDDRYNQTDTRKAGDIYDIYKQGQRLHVRKSATLKYKLGIDLKLSHLLKCRETGTCKIIVSSVPEVLPVKSGEFGTVFLYTFHGLTDYQKSLKEIRRVIKDDGALLMIAVNDTVKKNFICHTLHTHCKKIGLNRLSDYFLKLDGGRQDEIGGIFSKSIADWDGLLKSAGFRIEEVYSQISPLLWRIYDTQTRPLLRPLITVNSFLKMMHLKLIFKALWFYLWFPILMVSYYVLAKPVKINKDTNTDNVFFAIKATPIIGL